jgi:cell division topological specificity factor MinE
LIFFAASRRRRRWQKSVCASSSRRNAVRADYLPLLRRELLEVIRKYVNVDPEAVVINLERDQGQEVLELTVALPEKIQGSKRVAGAKP